MRKALVTKEANYKKFTNYISNNKSITRKLYQKKFTKLKLRSSQNRRIDNLGLGLNERNYKDTERKEIMKEFASGFELKTAD